LVPDDRDRGPWLSCKPPTVGISPSQGHAHGANLSACSYRLPGPSCQTAWIDIPRKKPRISTGPSCDSPSRESLIPERITPRKRLRTSFKDLTPEPENIPPWHSATPNVKNFNQFTPHSTTPQRPSPAKPTESPSLKRVRTNSGISFRLADKETTRKPKLGSPLATPSSSRIKRKLECVDKLSLFSLGY
jgi:hypothetical protein